MLFFPNGVIVQNLERPTNYFKHPGIFYQGINSFHKYPLLGLTDSKSKALTEEVFSKITDDGFFEPLEFISNADLLCRYLKECDNQNISVRTLFIESNYTDEIWQEELPDMHFIGYEYCEIPFDCQIITDFSMHIPFKKFHKILNKSGMFNTIEDVCQFKKCYDEEFDNGVIGDGEMDTFICKVSEVNPESFKIKD